MLLGLGLVMAVVIVMLAFPQTGMGRRLRRALVEWPADALNRLQRGKVAAYLLLAVIGVVLVALFETEGMRLFGFLLPDTLMWFAVFDVGVFVDALLITGAILATNGLRALQTQGAAVPRQISTIMRRCAARAHRTVRPSSRPNRNTSDDEDPTWSVHPPYRAFSIA